MNETVSRVAEVVGLRTLATVHDGLSGQRARGELADSPTAGVFGE